MSPKRTWINRWLSALLFILFDGGVLVVRKTLLSMLAVASMRRAPLLSAE
jgi:hypothetical protein